MFIFKCVCTTHTGSHNELNQNYPIHIKNHEKKVQFWYITRGPTALWITVIASNIQSTSRSQLSKKQGLGAYRWNWTRIQISWLRIPTWALPSMGIFTACFSPAHADHSGLNCMTAWGKAFDFSKTWLQTKDKYIYTGCKYICTCIHLCAHIHVHTLTLCLAHQACAETPLEAGQCFCKAQTLNCRTSVAEMNQRR